MNSTSEENLDLYNKTYSNEVSGISTAEIDCLLSAETNISMKGKNKLSLIFN